MILGRCHLIWIMKISKTKHFKIFIRNWNKNMKSYKHKFWKQRIVTVYVDLNYV